MTQHRPRTLPERGRFGLYASPNPARKVVTSRLRHVFPVAQDLSAFRASPRKQPRLALVQGCSLVDFISPPLHSDFGLSADPRRRPLLLEWSFSLRHTSNRSIFPVIHHPDPHPNLRGRPPQPLHCAYVSRNSQASRMQRACRCARCAESVRRGFLFGVCSNPFRFRPCLPSSPARLHQGANTGGSPLKPTPRQPP